MMFYEASMKTSEKIYCPLNCSHFSINPTSSYFSMTMMLIVSARIQTLLFISQISSTALSDSQCWLLLHGAALFSLITVELCNSCLILDMITFLCLTFHRFSNDASVTWTLLPQCHPWNQRLPDGIRCDVILATCHIFIPLMYSPGRKGFFDTSVEHPVLTASVSFTYTFPQ